MGLTVVDHGDGTFHSGLPTGASTAPYTGNNLSWVYDGQQSFPCTRPGPSGSFIDADEPETGDNPTGGRNKLEGLVQIDNLGRRWRVSAIDHVAIDYAIADYWGDVDATIGLDLDPEPYTPPQDADSSPTGYWEYTRDAPVVRLDTCPAGGFIFDGESRSTMNIPGLSGAQRAVARVEGLTTTGASDGQCGGVLLSPRFVLTAAHCVSSLPATQLNVRVDSVTHSVVFVDPNPAFAVTDDDRDDFALLELGSPSAIPPMVLSRDSKTTAATRNLQRLSTDTFIENGGGSCTAITLSTVVYHPWEQVRGTKNGTIRLYADAVPGASGGPYYRVKTGQTTGRVLGIHVARRAPTGFVVGTTSTRVHSVGPRQSEFDQFVIARITD